MMLEIIREQPSSSDDAPGFEKYPIDMMPVGRNTVWQVAAIVLVIMLVLGVLIVVEPLISVVSVVAICFIGMMVTDRAVRKKTLVLFLAFVPLTGIVKAITGSRFAPLIFDLGMLSICALFLVERLFYENQGLGLLDLMLGAFLGLAFLQMFNPNVPSLQAGVEGFRKFAFMSIAFYVGRYILDERKLNAFHAWLAFLTIPIALYGVKQFFFISALDYRMVDLASASNTTYFMGGQLRPFSTLPGPFHLGLYLVISILLLLCWMMYTPLKPVRRILLLVVLLLQVGTLFLTRTKGNWVGLVVGIGMLVLMNQGNLLRKISHLFFLVILGGGAIGLFLILAEDTGAQVLQDAILAVTHPSESPTFLYRQQLWHETMLPAMFENPLLGYGTSSAGEGLRNLYEGTTSEYFSSHNLYFKVFLEMGLLGLVLFVLITSTSLKRGQRQLKRLNSRENMQTVVLLRWCVAVVVAFLVGGLVIPVLDAYPVNYYFWLCLGIISANHLPSRKKVEP